VSKKNKHKAMAAGYGECPVDKTYSGPLVRHHIRGRNVRDWNKGWNVVYVSPNTHALIHEGRITIDGWFLTSSGRELIWHYEKEQPVTAAETDKPYIIPRKETLLQSP